MITKLIKLKLQHSKHVNVQATCQRDPKVYATCHDPKIYPHTKFGIPTSNYIQTQGSTLLELKPEVKVKLTWNQLVTRQCSNMEPLP